MPDPDFSGIATLTRDELDVLVPPVRAWLIERRRTGGDPDRTPVMAAIEQVLAASTPARREELLDIFLRAFPPDFTLARH